MPLLRYVMALALRGVLGVFGLALTAYGLINVVGSAFMLSAMWKGLAETGDTPPMSFLLQHYGLYGGLAAVGIFLMVLAIRGAIARIRAGLPGEDEGVGATPASRLINVLIYGAGFCFGAFSMAVSVGPGTQMAMLVAQGVTVQAKVLSYDATDDPKVWTMRYQFTTKAGEIINDSMPTEPVKEKPSMNLFPNGIAVTYVATDPSQHAVTQNYSHSSFVFFMVTRLAVALVGLWGLIKNISPTPKPPAAESFLAARPSYSNRFTPEPQAPAARPTAATAAQRRASFGRRI